MKGNIELVDIQKADQGALCTRCQVPAVIAVAWNQGEEIRTWTVQYCESCMNDFIKPILR
jgi:hypothetical protein